MEKKKISRREAYTLQAIRESFLHLLRRKSMNEISVGELCEMADINRSTFYRHYADIYALLDSVCEECCQELFENMVASCDPAGSFEEEGYRLILQACSLSEKNKELYQLLLFKHPSSGFLQRITDAVLQHFIDQNRLMHTASTEAVLHYQYLITGMMGIWQYWLRDDCKTPKDLFAQIILIHIGGVEQVIESRL